MAAASLHVESSSSSAHQSLCSACFTLTISTDPPYPPPISRPYLFHLSLRNGQRRRRINPNLPRSGQPPLALRPARPPRVPPVGEPEEPGAIRYVCPTAPASKQGPCESTTPETRDLAMQNAILTLRQTDVHRLTNMCFKKCVTSVGSGGLASKEQSCMQNCVDRFMDSNLAVLKHLDQLRASQ